jgi:hypothetical protein
MRLTLASDRLGGNEFRTEADTTDTLFAFTSPKTYVYCWRRDVQWCILIR